MIIVISDIKIFAGEHETVNQLFDEGLAVLHLRKYENTRSEVKDLIERIKPEHRSKIALHQFHDLAKEFGIKRMHFSGESRKKTSTTALNVLKHNGTILSTSVHSVEEYNAIAPCFDYVFIGPVFNSISKPGYKAQAFDLTKIPRSNSKLIALGGIDKENCAGAFTSGYDGIALLGSIWKSENKLNAYKEIVNKCSTNAQ